MAVTNNIIEYKLAWLIFVSLSPNQFTKCLNSKLYIKQKIYIICHVIIELSLYISSLKQDITDPQVVFSFVHFTVFLNKRIMIIWKNINKCIEYRHMYKRSAAIIFSFLKPFIWGWLALIGIWLIWAIDLSLRPYLIKSMLDKLEQAPEGSNLFSLLLLPVSSYIAMSFLINIIFRLHDYIEAKLLPSFNQHVLLTSLAHIQQRSHVFFQQHFGGSLVTQMSQLSDALQELVEIFIKRFFSHAVALGIACYTLATVHKFLALILIVWIIGFFCITFYFSRIAQKLSETLSKEHSSLLGKIIDSISNMMVVRLFTRQNYEYQYLATEATRKARIDRELRWTNLKRQATVEATSNILLIFLFIYLIHARQEGQISIGSFALTLTLSFSIMGAMWNLSGDFLHFSTSLGKFSQSIHLLNATTAASSIEDKQKDLQVNQGCIEFKNLTFSYKNEEIIPLFSMLSVSIHGGQRVGLVGFSGSGKSTFINLLIRLFEAQQGTISIDDQDINEVNVESLHRGITYIPQEPMLFNRTIYENIKYGNMDASDAEIIEAATKAHASEFIAELPEGYNSIVGERGGKLSGGQRQRIAIARAFLKDSKILILDEPTSALDALSEYYIQQSLENLMEGKTVIVIAHRLSTLINMDRLLVFEKGKIVEDGSHAELLKKQGLYKQLWQQQITN